MVKGWQTADKFKIELVFFERRKRREEERREKEKGRRDTQTDGHSA